jgi:hypothetical protein
MVHVDRPVTRPHLRCGTYVRIKNTGKRPLELSSTYVTNRSYFNGRLEGEEIGDWDLPGAPVVIQPGEVKDVLYPYGIRTYRTRGLSVGVHGFQFYGFGARTNTAVAYFLPDRLPCTAVAALALLALWRIHLGRVHNRGGAA